MYCALARTKRKYWIINARILISFTINLLKYHGECQDEGGESYISYLKLQLSSWGGGTSGLKVETWSFNRIQLSSLTLLWWVRVRTESRDAPVPIFDWRTGSVWLELVPHLVRAWELIVLLIFNLTLRMSYQLKGEISLPYHSPWLLFSVGFMCRQCPVTVINMVTLG